MPTLREEILMMLAEGALCLLRIRSLFSYGHYYDYSHIRKTINRLEKDGLLHKEKREPHAPFYLTGRGRLLLEKHRACLRESPRSWDHRWRVVVFDIPEKRGDVRLYLRSFLKTLGFGKVQKSVWISPYDFEEQVREFARKLDIPQYIFQLTVERFSGLDERALAGSFWDIRRLHDQYQSLIQAYSQEMALTPATSESASILRKRFLNNLMWDYSAILAQDPQLPAELLPADWSGSSAMRFVERCHNSIPPNLL